MLCQKIIVVFNLILLNHIRFGFDIGMKTMLERGRKLINQSVFKFKAHTRGTGRYLEWTGWYIMVPRGSPNLS